jgi:multidrug transporter EmrE-like cation transporter
MYTYLWLVLAFSLNAVAALLVKHSNVFAELGLFNNLMPTAYARTIAYSICCLALSFVFFNLAARALPISIVYSVHVGMSLLIMTFFAWFLLDERLTPLQYIGIVILILGIVLINVSGRPDNQILDSKTELTKS